MYAGGREKRSPTQLLPELAAEEKISDRKISSREIEISAWKSGALAVCECVLKFIPPRAVFPVGLFLFLPSLSFNFIFLHLFFFLPASLSVLASTCIWNDRFSTIISTAPPARSLTVRTYMHAIPNIVGYRYIVCYT